MILLPWLLFLVVSHAAAQDLDTADAGAPRAASPSHVAPNDSTHTVAQRHGVELSLATALARARENNPTLRGQAAQGEAARAQQDRARAALLPTLTANAAYARTTSNFVPRPGYLGGGGTSSNGSIPPRTVEYSGELFNTFNFGVTAAVLLYDFNTPSTASGRPRRTRAPTKSGRARQP